MKVKLKDLCEFISGGTPRKSVEEYYTGTIPWITGADIQDDRISEPRHYITAEAIQNSATNMIPSGNILLVTRTGVGKVAITDRDICISQDFTGLLLDKNKIDVLYLYRYLQSCKDYFVRNQRGATIKGVTREIVSNLEVYIPYPDDPARSLAEQRRIVARLEALLGEVKAMREQVQTLQRDLNRLMESALAEVFPSVGQPLPEGWDSATLSEPKAQILSGFSCARKKMVSQGLLHLRPFNIDVNGEIDLSNCLYIPEDFVNNPTDFWLESGDILFNNTNSVELVGKSAIVRTSLPCAFSNHLTRIRITDKDYFEPHWILFFLRYLWQTGFFAANCNRWIGQAGYAPSKLTELSIPHPPITEQRRIVAYLDDIQQAVREAQELIQADLRAVEQLEQSILAAAFRGEL